jgi:hypothetical protein
MNMTPIAQSLAAQGRNGDSMLVHMTPNEVGGLQALAQSAGGSLSINPTTGMPEANFLESILPMVIGAGLSFIPGVGPLMAAGLVGGGTTLLTGDLNKGLMAGLGAFGGAGIGTTLAGLGAGAGFSSGVGATLADATAADVAAFANLGSAPTASTALSNAGVGLGEAFANPGAFGSQLVSNLGGPLGAGAAGLGVLGGFSAANQPSMVQPTTSAESTYEGPYMPVEREVRYPDVGRTSTSEFDYFNPSNPTPGFQTFADGGEIDFNLQPAPLPEPVQAVPEAKPEGDPIAQMLLDFMMPGFREALSGETYVSPEERARIQQVLKSEGYTKGDSGGSGGFGGTTVIESAPVQTSGGFGGTTIEKLKKTIGDTSDRRRPSPPPPIGIDSKYGFQPFSPGGVASIAGGEFMEDGSFVIDARTVSELGNGSSNAGLELLMRLGGRPVEGPGDGVSDSIPATIDGTQDAAVARDEVIFTPQAVAAIGGGDAGRGRELLYEMMRQAEKARKEVDRGEDSGAGLKALSMAGAV